LHKFSFYVIIESGEKEYTYYYGTRKRMYPSGRFQGWYQINAYVDPETGKVIEEREPFPSSLERIKDEFIGEIEDEFHVFIEEGDITVGESNVKPELIDEIDTPIKKVRLERIVDKPVPKGYYPTRDWARVLERYI